MNERGFSGHHRSSPALPTGFLLFSTSVFVRSPRGLWPHSSYLSVCGRASRAVAIWTPTLARKWEPSPPPAPLLGTKSFRLSL